MLYNEKALKGLAKRIGMKDPLWYLIEGKYTEGVYRHLNLEMPVKKGDYSIVAEAIGKVLDSEEFRRRPGPRKVTLKPKFMLEYFSVKDIEDFKRLYGIGYEKTESYKSLCEERLSNYKWLKRTAKRTAKRFPPKIKLKEERELQNTVKWVVKILRDGKDKARPAEYRSKIWRYVHKKLRGT